MRKENNFRDWAILVCSIFLMLGIIIGLINFLWGTLESDMADNLDEEAEWLRETEEGVR